MAGRVPIEINGLVAASFMSQINPFRGIVVPSSQPQRVQPKKDRQQGRSSQQHHEPAKEEREKLAEDGKAHIDLKA